MTATHSRRAVLLGAGSLAATLAGAPACSKSSRNSPGPTEVAEPVADAATRLPRKVAEQLLRAKWATAPNASHLSLLKFLVDAAGNVDGADTLRPGSRLTRPDYDGPTSAVTEQALADVVKHSMWTDLDDRVFVVTSPPSPDYGREILRAAAFVTGRVDELLGRPSGLRWWPYYHLEVQPGRPGGAGTIDTNMFITAGVAVDPHILAHEYVHCRQISTEARGSAARIPFWFVEGSAEFVAQVASGRKSDYPRSYVEQIDGDYQRVSIPSVAGVDLTRQAVSGYWFFADLADVLSNEDVSSIIKEILEDTKVLNTTIIREMALEASGDKRPQVARLFAERFK